MSNLKNDKIRQNVIKTYGSIAKNGGSCCAPTAGCCSEISANPAISEKMGYGNNELAAVPEGANLGLGCGNPQAIAELKPGETVLDLGSGGGLDCFLAARQVGENGKAIGVDMTPEMLTKARENAAKAGLKNVEFRLGEIEHLPVADNSIDVIVSNCVVNLSPEKAQVFAEVFRVLKKGGRVAISDVVALQPFPEEMLKNEKALCSCVSGAVSVEELEQIIKNCGFAEVKIELKPESREMIKTWFPDAEKFVCSANINAVKE
jgi:SAM-dependent methyltransferase